MANLDFNIKKLDNFKFDQYELLEYFNILERDYQHLKWSFDTKYQLDTKNHRIQNLYSYQMQSNFKDNSIPHPPYHVKPDIGWRNKDNDIIELLDDDGFNNSTDCMFGITERIYKLLPNIRQMGISVHPPGTFIDLHIDTIDFIKVHIPIVTNEHALFCYEDIDYKLEVGNAYIVNTMNKHGTINNGTTNRAHLIFKINVEDIDYLLDNKIVI